MDVVTVVSVYIIANVVVKMTFKVYVSIKSRIKNLEHHMSFKIQTFQNRFKLYCLSIHTRMNLEI